MTQVSYRQLMTEDKAGLLELFGRLRPSMVSTSNRLVYRAIIDDAMCSRNVVIYAALLDSKLVGYVIAAWDWNYFKRMFILRHPLIGLVIIAKKLKKKLLAQNSSTSDLRREDVDTLSTARNTAQTYAWEDSAKSIAKVIHIGVDSQVRSRGVGRGLYANLIKHLSQHGFTRIDALIEKDNLASMNMHKKAGWTVIEGESGFYAFLEVNPE